jgi:hypothetical protein
MNSKKTLLTGIKLGIQITAISMFFSPVIVYIHLFLLALERGVSPVGIYYELYCFGGPIIVFLCFSLPYLFGGIILACLVGYLKGAFMLYLGSALVGMFSSMVGNWILYNEFLTPYREALYASEWALVGIMELWSIVVFVWMENRRNRSTAINDREAH